MKKLKSAAVLVLAATMVFGMTSCFGGGLKAEKFYDYALENIDCEEYTVKELNKMDKSEMDEAKEDGIILYFNDTDDIDDFIDFSEEQNESSTSETNMIRCYVTQEDFKAKDLTELAYYKRDDANDEKQKMTSDSIIVMNFKDSASAKKAFESMLDRVEDDIDVDLESLSEDEYKYKGSKGYLLINADDDTFIDAFIYGYAKAYGQEIKGDDLKEARKTIKNRLGKMNCYMGSYLNGNTIVTVLCLTNENGTDTIDAFCEDFKFTCPDDIENSEDFVDCLIENLITN